MAKGRALMSTRGFQRGMMADLIEIKWDSKLWTFPSQGIFDAPNGIIQICIRIHMSISLISPIHINISLELIFLLFLVSSELPFIWADFQLLRIRFRLNILPHRLQFGNDCSAQWGSYREEANSFRWEVDNSRCSWGNNWNILMNNSHSTFCASSRLPKIISGERKWFCWMHKIIIHNTVHSVSRILQIHALNF